MNVFRPHVEYLDDLFKIVKVCTVCKWKSLISWAGKMSNWGHLWHWYSSLTNTQNHYFIICLGLLYQLPKTSQMKTWMFNLHLPEQAQNIFSSIFSTHFCQWSKGSCRTKSKHRFKHIFLAMHRKTWVPPNRVVLGIC